MQGGGRVREGDNAHGERHRLNSNGAARGCGGQVAGDLRRGAN